LQIKDIESNEGGSARKEILSNIIDNNLSSFWASNELGVRLNLDLGTEERLCYIEIAWRGGTTHSYNYTIYLSTDYSHHKVGEQLSDCKFEYPEVFNLDHEYSRYVDINTTGSNLSSRTAISEIKIYGIKQ
jgi:hypothetical protein